MLPDSAGPLLNEFLGNSFLFEGHKAEVLGFVVLGLVNGPNNLHIKGIKTYPSITILIRGRSTTHDWTHLGTTARVLVQSSPNLAQKAHLWAY